jgi:DNA primase
MSDPVLELLNSKGLSFTISGRDYLIKCLNPEHPDSNPSMRVDRVSGMYHCFSCSYKGNIFKYFGIFTNQIPIKIAKLKEKIQELKRMSTGLAELPGSVPYTRSHRGISVETLKYFGAFFTTQVDKMEDRIIFPIKSITGKTEVYVGRHLLSKGNPRYLNYPGGVQIPLFPASVPRGSRSMVLVEGLFDMLNLYDKGLDNAVACFGTNTLQKDMKQKLMPYRAQGVTKVFIMFDGDEAGRKASSFLKPLIEEEGFEVEIISLDDGDDPGDLDQENVSSIVEYVK